LLGHVTRPSEAAIRVEVKIRLQEALNAMDGLDREVLALRHFEQLSNREAALVLGIQEKAAGKRYLRALKRLKEILASMPGGTAGLEPCAIQTLEYSFWTNWLRNSPTAI